MCRCDKMYTHYVGIQMKNDEMSATFERNLKKLKIHLQNMFGRDNDSKTDRDWCIIIAKLHIVDKEEYEVVRTKHRLCLTNLLENITLPMDFVFDSRA